MTANTYYGQEGHGPYELDGHRHVRVGRGWFNLKLPTRRCHAWHA